MCPNVGEDAPWISPLINLDPSLWLLTFVKLIFRKSLGRMATSPNQRSCQSHLFCQRIRWSHVGHRQCQSSSYHLHVWCYQRDIQTNFGSRYYQDSWFTLSWIHEDFLGQLLKVLGKNYSDRVVLKQKKDKTWYRLCFFSDNLKNKISSWKSDNFLTIDQIDLDEVFPYAKGTLAFQIAKLGSFPKW